VSSAAQTARTDRLTVVVPSRLPVGVPAGPEEVAMIRRRVTRTDHAHHHPVVRRTVDEGWRWSCACGATCVGGPLEWHQVLVQALLHSSAIAP
jgi:hypothetical protein